ncbi:unnamed protein product [Cylindrotheca closterium]|uniref:Uncharacterized protein n=1 Tax=Cylindrotheca closterium TaxID=2856 RepID=A0AAD2CMW8_9STRA|nr:unnamed protein product [Cylindrotheca closterium]
MTRLLHTCRCIKFNNRNDIARQLSSSSSSEITRSDIVDEASALTRSLYRLCLRSVKVIRHGNEFDEKDFQRRDEEFSNPTPGGVMSMAPPPNREDELRSRAEYYQSYAREYFIQESDCLDNDPLQERDIRRFLYYLRKGEKDRKWLLGDMLFPDPYKTAFDVERIEKFESMTKTYLGEDEEEEIAEGTNTGSSEATTSNGDDYFADAEDDLPDWVKKHMK